MDGRSPLQWIERVLADLTYRSPFGVVWSASSEELPIRVEIHPADRPTYSVVLSESDDDTVSAVVAFAVQVQEVLTDVFGERRAVSREGEPPPDAGSVPACPLHDHALVAARGDEGPSWACPESDWSRPFGDYEDSFWPFGPDARSEDVNSGIFRHLQAAGVSWSGGSNLKKEDGDWVLCVRLRMRDDSPAAVRQLRDAMAGAVALVRVEVESVTALRTVRYRKEPENGPPYKPGREGLRTTGASRLALLQGVLRRPVAEETCDVVVESSPGRRTRVRLGFDHETTDSGSPFLLDHSSSPFADEGDEVALGGGYLPSGHIPGGAPVFFAGSIERIDQPPHSQGVSDGRLRP